MKSCGFPSPAMIRIIYKRAGCPSVVEYVGSSLMSRVRAILDCYTDEPAGLGVPPFLGVWPRYVAGRYKEVPTYLTIDDLRLLLYSRRPNPVVIDPPTGRTRIEALNSTRSPGETDEVLRKTSQLTVIVGVQTPGKYLSARPGTLNEVHKLLADYKLRRILTGPVVECGTQMRGGSRAKMPDEGDFDEIRHTSFDSYEQMQDRAVKGAAIFRQFPRQENCVVEIETGRGCPRSPGCSFCTEPIKNPLQWREPSDIVEEVTALLSHGARAFRLGKQSCIYSYQGGSPAQLERLLRGLAELGPDVLHVDNVNPTMVDERRTALFVKYLTPGSTAAMGVESFDPQVVEQNNLNCSFEAVFEAIRTINRIGAERGENGCHALLPGINILLGLKGETRDTLDKNFAALAQILEEGLLVRRINIRQVVPYPGTALHEETGRRFLRKNRRHYAPWIERVRREIDVPMLRRLFPAGTVLRRLCSEVHNGQITFLRQVVSYPIVVGVHERLDLGRFYDVRVTGYMRRSLTAELV